MPIISILDIGYESYEYERQLFAQNGYELYLYSGDPSDSEAKIRFAENSEGIIVRGTLVDQHFLSKVFGLKAIVRYGTGYDNINLEVATRKGIKVANVQGYANHAVSDHAISLMFACIRGLFPGAAGLYSDYGKPPFPEIFEMHDKTLGIIGLGRIGSTFCRKVRPLFQRVLAVDPYLPGEKFDECDAGKVSLEEVFAESHVISVHCSLTEETRHMLDHSAFKAMQQMPVIINTARGPVIDQQALLYALNNMLIHSAGLDLLEHEPPNDKDRLVADHSHTIVTGHYAWYSTRAMYELQTRAANNIIKLLKGEKIPDQIN